MRSCSLMVSATIITLYEKFNQAAIVQHTKGQLLRRKDMGLFNAGLNLAFLHLTANLVT